MRRDDRSASRRNEILGAAQRLVATKGYEQMTIEDILTDLGISKGAFYHYFDSKADLLQSLVETMREEAGALLLPILQDPGLSALQKIQAWFDVAAGWKTTRKDYLLSLLRVWYDDDNAVVRQKLRADSLAWLNPHLTRVVEQGIGEGVLATPFPELAGQVVFALIYELGESLAVQILSGDGGDEAMVKAENTTAAYTDAIERVLRIEAGSLRLIDPELMRRWFVSPVSVA